MKESVMRLQSVVFAVSCLLSNAADCVAGPIGIFRSDRTSNTAVVSSFHHVNNYFAELGAAAFGNEGRYLRWDDILMQEDGDITFDRHSPVVQLLVSTPNNPGYAR